MQLKEQFIEQVGEILQKADISVVPTELAKMEGFFEGIQQVSNTAAGSKGARK